jgi:hypothetical protein
MFPPSVTHVLRASGMSANQGLSLFNPSIRVTFEAKLQLDCNQFDRKPSNDALSGQILNGLQNPCSRFDSSVPRWLI